MTRIIVDDKLLTQLRNLSEPLELCDAAGRLLGRVIPSGIMDFEEPPIPEDELRRREASTEWFTTEQVLEHLKKLESR